jgi:pyruvate,orthophosphate dikinase
LRIACDLVREGVIGQATALGRLAGYDLDSIRLVRLAGTGERQPVCAGTPASPGVAVGPIALNPESAAAMAAAGHTPVLVREDLSTADNAGLAAAADVLMARGGRTSHAAFVARQLNKVCIVGCRELAVPGEGAFCCPGGRRFT